MSSHIIDESEFIRISNKVQLLKLIECDFKMSFPTFLEQDFFNTIKERFCLDHVWGEREAPQKEINEYFLGRINHSASRMSAISKLEQNKKIPLWCNGLNIIVGCEDQMKSKEDARKEISIEFVYKRFIKFKKELLKK